MNKNSKLTLFCNQKVDYVLLSSKTPTQEELDKMKDPYIKPDWNDIKGTEILAPFNSNLVSTYVSGIKSPIKEWAIYRQKKGDKRICKVAQVYCSQLSIVDYLVANNNEYRWEIVAMTEDEIGSSLNSDYVKTNNWDYTITGLSQMGTNTFIANEVWTFSLNVTEEQKTQVMDKTKFQTYTKFPKFAQGKSNYLESSISCLLGGVNNLTYKYDESNILAEKWQEFVAKDQVCLLKDPKGNIFRVKLQENSFKNMENVLEQPSIISFTYFQCGETDNMEVYAFE